LEEQEADAVVGPPSIPELNVGVLLALAGVPEERGLA